MSTLILRSQPICPHCAKEDGGNVALRYVTMNGNRCSCAVCGIDFGEVREVTIPSNVANIYEMLIKRAALRVEYPIKDLNTHMSTADDQVVPVKVDTVVFKSRAARSSSLQCNLDWHVTADKTTLPRAVSLDDGELRKRIETFPTAIALAAQVFLNEDFVVIEIPREGARQGTIRFRKLQPVDSAAGQPSEGQTLIRGQLFW